MQENFPYKDLVLSADRSMKIKESEKRHKYLDLAK